MVCYFGSWAVYRQGLGKFDVEDIDPKICTHIIFGFAGLAHDSSIRVRSSLYGSGKNRKFYVKESIVWG